MKKIYLEKFRIYFSALKIFVFLLLLFSFTRAIAQTAVTIPPFYNLNAGGADNAFPLNSAASNMAQWVIAPGSINSAGATGTAVSPGYITKVYFLLGATVSNTAVYTNFTLKLAQNVGTLASWPAASFNPGMTTVYSAPSFTITGAAAGTWIMVPLTTPFYFDPTLSLVFEMSVSAGIGNQMRQSTIVGNSRQWGLTGGAATGFGTGQLNFGIDLVKAGNDAGVTNFTSPSPAVVGSNSVITRIRNFGSNIINAINVNWSVNGALQTPVSYSLPIDTLNGAGSNTALVTLGSLVVAPNVTYRVKAWTSSPNGVADTIPLNDTSAIIYRAPALSGVYTIGATGDFTSITEAAIALNSAGVSGPVTFNLIDNLYATSTGEVFPISFNNIVGTSAINTITFKPALGTQPLISDSSSASIFVINGTKWINIDGRFQPQDTTRNITFENRSLGSSSNVISYLNEANDHVLRNCVIRSANLATTASGSVFIGGSSASNPFGNDRILIRSNTFAGSRGNFYATGLGSIGASAFAQNDAIRIDSNYFYNFRSNGVFASPTSSGIGNNWLIQGNHFYDTLTTTGANVVTCINFNPSTSSNSNGDTIRGNFIGGNAPYAPRGIGQRWIYNGTGTFQGIVSSGGSGTGSAILNNSIRSFKVIASLSTGQIVGITASNPGLARIDGNTIGDMNDTSSIWTNTTSAFIGINAFTTNDVWVTNNLISNINVVGNNASSAARGIVLGTGSTNTANVNGNWIRAMHTRSTNIGTTSACAWNGIVVTASSPNQNIINNTIGGSNPTDSCSVYYGPASNGELPAGTAGGARMIGIVQTLGANNTSNNLIKSLYSQSNVANSVNTSANIIGILTSSSSSGQVINNNIIDSLILRTPAVGTMIAGIVSASGGATISNNSVGDFFASSINTSTSTGAAITGINISAVQAQVVIGNTIFGFENTSVTANQMSGIVLSAAAGNLVRNNTIRNLRSATTSASGIIGINNANTSLNTVITGNTIHSLVSFEGTTGTPGLFGIVNNGSTTIIGNNASVTKNIIHSFGLNNTGTGIATLTGIQAASGNALYANNMVRIGRDTAGATITRPANIRGIQLAITGAIQNRFYHNSIYVESSPLTGTTNTVGIDLAGNITAPGIMDIRNNIVVNNTLNGGTATGNHYVIRHNGNLLTNYTINSNIYNNPVAATAFLGRFNLVDYLTLNAWKAGVLTDGASGFTNPNFLNTTGNFASVNLKLASANPAERGGDSTLFSFVNDDIDGTLRDTLTRTDIGADAANGLISADVNAPIINYTPLSVTTSITNRVILANIYDGGGLPLDASKLPRIYYRKMAIGAWLSEPGTLVSGNRFNGNWSFNISSSALGAFAANDSIYYYIIAEDSLGVNVNSNGMFANATGVLSVTTHPLTPNSYRINSPFPSVITVGTGQPYTTLTGVGGVFEAINSSNLSANTEIQITSDITELGTVSLNKWQEQGIGGYILTIRPQANAQVVLSSAVTDANGLIKLNNTNGVKILGWSPSGTPADTNLIIRASNLSTPALGFINGGINDTFQNVIFESRISNASSGVIFVAATNFPATNGVSNLLIQRCHVRQDITLFSTTPTNGVFIIGNSPRMNSNIRIDGNFIYNILGTGGNAINVNGTGAGNGNNFTITNNHFYFTGVASITLPYQAITFGTGVTSDNNVISNNWIGGTAPFAGGGSLFSNNQMVPISVTSGTINGSVINNNVISNISLTGISGMTAIFTQGTNAVYTINGNRIGDWNNQASSINFTSTSNNRLQGINSTGTGNVTISNDTVVNILNSGVGTIAGITGILVGSGTSNNTVILNNIIRNLVVTGSTNVGTATTSALLGILCTSSSTNQIIRDNIVRSLVMTSVASNQVVGIFNSTGITTISGNSVYGIQSASTSINTGSSAAAIIGICNNSSTTGIHTTINNIVDSIWYFPTTPSAVQMMGIAHSVNTTIHQSMIFDNVVRNMNSRSTQVGTAGASAIIGIFQNNPTLNLQVSRNSVSILNHLNTNAASIIGIYNNASGTINANNSIVNRNFVHSFKSAATNPNKPVFTGIFNNAGFTTYSNNMIRIGIDSAGVVDTSARVKRGIFQNNNVQNRYYHNTILIAGASLSSVGYTNSAAIELGTTIPNIVGFNVKVEIRNNILVNQSSATLPNDTSKHYALRFIDTINIVSNNNLFYLTGINGFVAGTNTTDYQTLFGTSGSWAVRTGIDLQSGFGDPMLNTNATGTADLVSLAVQGTTPIENSGDPTLNLVVTDDFYGTSRLSNASSDIGAHSGNFNQAPDLFAPVISFTPLIASGTLSGVRPFTNVSIKDNNGIPTSGSDRPRVYFSKDGVNWASTASSTTTGTSNNAIVNFNIDYALLGPLTSTDTIRYYVIAQDNSGNTLSNASYAIASGVNAITSHPVNPNRYNFLPVLAANTIINVGVGQTYTSLSGLGGAFEFINGRTLGGNIFLDITSDLLNETGAVALNQFGEDGLGAGTYTVTIRPTSGTVTERLISGNASNAMITLNNASRVKITGVPTGGLATNRFLRFRNSNTTASTILIRNGAQGVRLNNLIIEGGNTSGNAGVVTFAVSAGSIPCSNDSITGCLVLNNQSVTFPNGIPAFLVYTDGAIGVLNANMVFTNNEFANYGNSGIGILNNNGNGFIVTNNSFYNNLPTIPSSTQFVGINAAVGPNSSGNIFSNNFIGGSAPNCGGSPWTSTSISTAFVGIRAAVGSGANTLIQNNIIRNIAFTNTGTSVFNGINNDQGNSIITGNVIGSTTSNNSIVFANATTHTAINYSGSSSSMITGNTIAGLTIGTLGQTASLNCITVSNGAVSNIDNNIIGGTLSASIVNLGTGITNGLNLSVPINLIPSYSVSNNTVQNISMPGTQASTIIRGILLAGGSVPNAIGNSITNITSNGTTIASTGTGHLIAGITIATSSNVVPILRNNTISGLRALNTTAGSTPNVSGIVLSTGQSTVIDANRIFDLTNASTSTSALPTPSVAAINIGGGSVNAFVTNNQITLGNAQTSNTQFIGIWLNISSTAFILNALHNSVFVTGTSAGGNQNSYAFLRGNNSTSELATFLNLRNNIFANNRTGGTGFHFAIANQTPTPSNTTWVPSSSQYNLMVTSNTSSMGQWGLNPLNYAAWIGNSASTSDAMSYYMQSGSLSDQLNL